MDLKTLEAFEASLFGHAVLESVFESFGVFESFMVRLPGRKVREGASASLRFPSRREKCHSDTSTPTHSIMT